MFGKRARFLDQTAMGLCRCTLESDSGRVLIWREQDSRCHQSKIVQRRNYRPDGISLGGHNDFHVFRGRILTGALTAVKYRDEILYPYGVEFIVMDDIARRHRSR
ncbi:hypothetical protein AVEN_13143-1 [Araneus ventricosus]|uniref:Uncharacterized protein n=1 Tax=Araneus ventricosus TaxID=182803 RepID=A0A4Y2KY09_ARAVE|nr:hypothetical protein AVEN_13143-1 [Araneus ventricosus]